ncbi:MAG: IS200/IS605 family transposase [Galactobacillus timonensis]|uniref:IS200/IS605 family transposase n=1 Tax=Galactobacillus timonensis TaxID=2041840 RepID=UPI0023F594D9|nr:IS200/IS605 family transposase [Galactobacillus timonensis]MDD7680647.1 IS200/IS605 family transposase [Stecheria intestinalis]MDY4681366.1 IS200/IS605 family transposase [Lachnospiraceae bacterium]MCI6067300.1 IS200/IS605 family transposase [Galactobacillus timonensis]MCI6755030.1 IS200/IS605 family transposase [Galactobacillus timonensis]MDD7086139.1 IS200/IS605 family transposase [Galactobacillus timonensis]
MEKDAYRRTNTTVSLLNYHFVFCPRYRRKIFDVPGVDEYFKKLVTEVCGQHDLQILAMECDHDHVHLFVSAPPTTAPYEIMKWIKGATSRKIRMQFSALNSMSALWTRSYFVSTAGKVSSATIRHYVETQKTRP